jgi:hypothetical protein
VIASLTPSRPRAFSPRRNRSETGLRLRGAEPEADDLAPAVGVDRDGYYGGDRDDPPALANLEVGRVEPEAGPRAGQRPLEEVAHPLVDVLGSSFETALLEMPLSPIACTGSSTRRVETPPIHASWITAASAFLRGPPRL